MKNNAIFAKREPYGVRALILVSMTLALLWHSSAMGASGAYTFTTFAGPDAVGSGAVDGTGSVARFSSPQGVAVDASGNVYVADGNSTIRKITSAGVVTTLAGTVGTFGSMDGTGSAASFAGTYGVAVDSSGNVYVADRVNQIIRKITSAGIVTTLAGTANRVPNGSADGTGSAARFYFPQGVAVDSSGNVYVADTGNQTIRKITPAGVVTTLAGTANTGGGSTDGTGSAASFGIPTGVAVDGSGNVYVADSGNNNIRKITSAGVVTTLAGTAGNQGSTDGTGSAASFGHPYSVAVDASGNVYVADQYNDTIRKITSAGVVTTLAGTALLSGSADGTGSAARFAAPQGVAVDVSGNVYVADGNSTIRKITSGGVVTTLAGPVGLYIGGIPTISGESSARFWNPTGVAVDASGNVYVADYGNNTILKITSAGVVTTLAGTSAWNADSSGVYGSTDGTGSVARFNGPGGVAVDSSGNVYVADQFNQTIRKITSAGVVTTLAGTAGVQGSADGTGSAASFFFPYGVAVDSFGNVYVADTGNNTIRKITSVGVVTTLAGTTASNQGSTDGTGRAASFWAPAGVAVDASGNVYVADQYNSTIRKITSAGVVTTLAGTAGTGGSADGTGSAASFYNPIGVAVDSSGNVYVTDANSGAIYAGINNTIRKITSAGVVTTLAGTTGTQGSMDGTGSAARFNGPGGVAVDVSGNVYVADYNNNTIRNITSAGVVTTLVGTAISKGSADGTGSSATFYNPQDVAVDVSGNVYVADTGNSTIRKITSAGVVTTLAGAVVVNGSTDGIGNAASFYGPWGVAVDVSGNVYVADTGNNTIRKITSAGVVTTLAGTANVFGGSADGTGSAASFGHPYRVAVDVSGNVYVADTGNSTIRKITSAGVVTTLAGTVGTFGSTDGTGSAASFAGPRGVAVDASGNVYVADTGNSTIRKITSVGVVTTLAGTAGQSGSVDGTGSAARFDGPSGVAVDASDNVYVTGANNIRKITSAGVVTTLAGTAGTGGSVDGTGSAASFGFPSGIAVDGSGNVYVADSAANNIRIGVPALADIATIDATTGPLGVARQFNTAPQTATTFSWSIIRYPSASTAILSSTTIANPTFTPDIADLFTFQLVATSASGKSFSTVSLMGTVPPTISSPLTANGTTGITFNYTITATGSPTITFTASPLPAGLTFSGSTISGTPTAAGSTNVTLTASNGTPPNDNKTLVIAISNPVPTLTSISPTAVVAGSGAFTLTLTGTNFVATSMVNWSGQADLTPATQTATQITVNVPAAYIAVAGTPSVTVFNPVPGGGVSTAQTFTIIFAATNTAPKITSTLTAGGVLGSAFSYTITANGSPTITFTASPLPAGLTLSGATISGTPTAVGSTNVTLTAGNGTAPNDTQTLVITITAAPVAPSITSALTASGATGVQFNYAITASGTTPINFTATPLPAGLTLTGATISGTPTASGSTNVALGASNGTSPNDNKTLVITITGPVAPVITSALTATGKVGSSFTYTVTASGTAPITFTAASLPNGLSLNGAAISGTPTAAGTTNVTLTAANGISPNDTKTLVITIGNPAAPLITSSLTVSATQGQPFSYQITANNNPTSFAATGLPDGLSVNAAGLIAGSSIRSGMVGITISATNVTGTDTETLVLTVALAAGAATPAAPQFQSPPTTPAPAPAGTSITFTAPVGTQGSLVLVTWNFGDGTTATGGTVTHTFTTAGVYQVNVTLNNGTSTTTQTLDVAVDSILAANAAPLPGTLQLAKGTVAFNFKTQKDAMTLAGTLTLPAQFAPSAKAVIVAMGAFELNSTLNNKGKSADKSFSLTGKLKNGTFQNTAAKFQLTLKNQALFAKLSPFGFVNDNLAKPGLEVNVPVVISIDGNGYLGTAKFMYMAKKGKTGAGKF